jgi:aspartate kinase
VDGVYSADPHLVPHARRLARLSYDEMLELARLGAKVLQARSVLFAKRYAVPVVVKSSFSEAEGTLITKADTDMEQVVVAGVVLDKNQAKITLIRLPDRPGIAAKLFGSIANAHLVVDMIIQNASEAGLTDISFTVPRTDAQQALECARQLVGELGAEDATLQTGIAKVSIVGVGMQSQSGVAARMFDTLARENINILMISTSEIKVSCVIQDKYAELAVRVLHETFELGEDTSA